MLAVPAIPENVDIISVHTTPPSGLARMMSQNNLVQETGDPPEGSRQPSTDGVEDVKKAVSAIVKNIKEGLDFLCLDLPVLEVPDVECCQLQQLEKELREAKASRQTSGKPVWWSNYLAGCCHMLHQESLPSVQGERGVTTSVRSIRHAVVMINSMIKDLSSTWPNNCYDIIFALGRKQIGSENANVVR